MHLDKRILKHFIEENSIKKEQINWTDLKTKVHDIGQDDKTIEDAQNTIRIALGLLNDNHSMLISHKKWKEMFSDTSTKKIQSISSSYENGIGYIKIPSFIGNDRLCMQFAKTLQSCIKELDKNKLSGWIIDLRENGGGNMWPMLLGIGPLLGDGIAGYFVDNKNNYEKWGYSEGKTFAEKLIVSSSDSVYHLKNTDKKIAVLIRNRTLSSGEAIAVAFKGLPNSRFFGNKSGGLTTGNQGYVLSDSAVIYLTTSVYADRNKTQY